MLKYKKQVLKKSFKNLNLLIKSHKHNIISLHENIWIENKVSKNINLIKLKKENKKKYFIMRKIIYKTYY